MPYRFTTGDIKKIAQRLGLNKVNKKKWDGIDVNGNFLQMYIHEHGDGIEVLTGTAKQHSVQMGFKDLDDMYDFLMNKKRKR